MRGEVKISTHAPAGGATRAQSPDGRHELISTHAPAGGATRPGRRAMLLLSHFYSRPCGRGDCNRYRRRLANCHFYSRPCGRGDVGWPKNASVSVGISTHAPAGGATDQDGRLFERPCISTHAPAGGATDFPVRAARHGADFYSRPCGRGDAEAVNRQTIEFRISTHAPAGGATSML